jgi:transposase-like protein
VGSAPLAIVWPCRLSVAEYAAAGKRIDVPAQACPGCGIALTGWSGYWRWLRDGIERHIWIARGRCARCRRTHALLPDFVHARRLDAVDVIGAALESGIGGAGMRGVADRLGLAHSTARDWRRRHRARAPALLAHLAAVAVSLGAELRDLPAGVEAAALHALRALWEQVARRLPRRSPPPWRLWDLVCGGWALGTNTSPPLADAWPVAWMR